jgi:hypothetical protein
MTEQCLARLMKDKQENRGYFGTSKSRFYFEYRCKNSCDGQLCSRCSLWKTTSWQDRGLKKKDPYREYYGLVTEPIPEPFFESEWYQSKVKQVGEPSETDMVRAKKAQDEAKKNIVVQKADPVEEKQTPSEPKKRGRKPKQVSTPVPVPPVPTPDPNPPPSPNPPPKPSTKRRPKAEPLVKTSQELTYPIQAVEASTPLEDIEIVKILVKPFTYNDTGYFRDVKKNKLYSVGKDKRPLAYIGRWNAETETIDTEFPDSDAEI